MPIKFVFTTPSSREAKVIQWMRYFYDPRYQDNWYNPVILA